MQNLALKPTEALFVQPLTPVEIIRSAMLLREAVPYLQENAARIREDLEKSKTRKIWSKNRLRALSVRKNFGK